MASDRYFVVTTPVALPTSCASDAMLRMSLPVASLPTTALFVLRPDDSAVAAAAESVVPAQGLA